jgi:glycosyltransferase involved in cell wall biosynthesis
VETGERPLVRRILRNARSISWRLHRTLSLRSAGSFVRRHPASVVYANTIASGELLSVLAMPGVPAITHVHELRGIFEECRREGTLDHTLRHSDRFIAVADAVKENLVQGFGVPSDKVDVCYGFVPWECFSEVRIESAVQKVRTLIGAEPDNMLFVACGTLSARKGADLFLAVARRVREDAAMRDSHFVWVGGNASSPERAALVKEAESLGIQDHVHFLGHRTDYLDFLGAADVCLLTSREDPFPLVVLEAAGFGKPVVCFEGGGGAPEFVRSDAGVCVPLADVQAMAAAAIALARSPATRAVLGAAARQRVSESHCVDAGASRIYDILRRFLPEGAVGRRSPARGNR